MAEITLTIMDVDSDKGKIAVATADGDIYEEETKAQKAAAKIIAFADTCIREINNETDS